MKYYLIELQGTCTCYVGIDGCSSLCGCVPLGMALRFADKPSAERFYAWYRLMQRNYDLYTITEHEDVKGGE